jgi:hypothetical protein
MIPWRFTQLEAIPYSANGKVDRKALPSPEHSVVTGTNPFIAPQSPTERALATLWKDILQVPQIGVDDNFFDVGGSSFTLIALRSRISEFFGVKLTIPELFEATTIRALGAKLDGGAMDPSLAGLARAELRIRIRNRPAV